MPVMCRWAVLYGGGLSVLGVSGMGVAWSGLRPSFPPGPKPRLVVTLGESDIFGPGGGAGGVGYSKQAKQSKASKMFVELVVNDSTPGPGSVRDPPTSGGRGWQYAIARA